jgi:DNA-binding transcriptional ArsR family regulator
MSSPQDRPAVRLTDARALRAYAHPTRAALLSLLRIHGALTATQAGVLLGESSGSTSFHLRQLEKYGLVEPVPDVPGRAKPWQATSMMTDIPVSSDDPEVLDALVELGLAMSQRYFARLADWITRSSDEPAEWREAAHFGDRILYATPSELVALRDAIGRLIEPLARRLDHPDERPEDARPVTFLRIAFPDKEPRAGDHPEALSRG